MIKPENLLQIGSEQKDLQVAIVIDIRQRRGMCQRATHADVHRVAGDRRSVFMVSNQNRIAVHQPRDENLGFPIEINIRNDRCYRKIEILNGGRPRLFNPNRITQRPIFPANNNLRPPLGSDFFVLHRNPF